MFCLVIAAVQCAFVPFGTVLGVFTIVALQKPKRTAAVWPGIAARHG